ncbi:MAG: hypothetical protein IKR05_05105 [Prevotella sp.]|nr:hypothetical protein [Prevotella sp.]
MRKLDYEKRRDFTMVGDSMDNGSKDSICNGDTMVCVPMKANDIVEGDTVLISTTARTIVGVVSVVGSRSVTLSWNNGGRVTVSTRGAVFYLVIETRHKRSGYYDGLAVCFRGMA